MKVGNSIFHTLDSFSDPFSLEGAMFAFAQNKKCFRDRSKTAPVALQCMGHTDQQVLLLNLSMFEKDVQSLWQRALQVSQYMPLRFWSKARTSLTENYSQLEKQMTGPC